MVPNAPMRQLPGATQFWLPTASAPAGTATESVASSATSGPALKTVIRTSTSEPAIAGCWVVTLTSKKLVADAGGATTTRPSPESTRARTRPRPTDREQAGGCAGPRRMDEPRFGQAGGAGCATADAGRPTVDGPGPPTDPSPS